ncbi:MAG TPA: 3-isopropylmalate dehydratase small subunit [Chloroflexota bacterium]|nr:3-isopropylmalate dehydratase small subunit [Chloroflexota bacterium]
MRGKVWKYGPNINTDVIIPGRYCHITDPAELAKHAMADLDPDFVTKMSPGDIVVAGGNFGCGSSREVAPLSLKAAGVAAVVAPSFARIFYRNAINIGFPIFESDEAYAAIDEGDEVEIEPASGIIRDVTKGTEYRAQGFPEFLQQIIARGGLRAYAEEVIAGRQEAPAAT